MEKTDKKLLFRYRQLIDIKYLRGLSKQEENELDVLMPKVDGILDKLRKKP